MSLTGGDIRSAALEVLACASPPEKTARARAVAADWRAGRLAIPPERAAALPGPPPGRPERPELAPPGKVPRRRLSSRAGQVALLHAVAHIEFNAIDLAFDMVARFCASPELEEAERADFISDWIGVGDDEARHFGMIADRLESLDAAYGDLPAHNGLWQAAEATSVDLAARLAVAPLVLEARGLDVTPGMIDRLENAGDSESARILGVIYDEEIGHVAAGARWFRRIAETRGEEPDAYFQALVGEYFKGQLKRPFNAAARERAGLPERYYAPLAD